MELIKSIYIQKSPKLKWMIPLLIGVLLMLVCAIVSGLIYVLVNNSNNTKASNNTLKTVITTSQATIIVTSTPMPTTVVPVTENHNQSNFKYLKDTLLQGYSITEEIVKDSYIKNGFSCTKGEVYKYIISKADGQYIDIYLCSNSSSTDLIGVAKSFFSHEYPEPQDGKNGSPSYIENSSKSINEISLKGYTGSFIDYGFTNYFDILGKGNTSIIIERGGYDTPWDGIEVGIDEYYKILQLIQIKF